MPLFNYLTHHLGSFGSIYDSTLINGFAPRMRRPTYGDRIVEIPINHTKDCLLYRNNSLRAAFKYKLILGTAARCTGGTASTMRCVGVFVPAANFNIMCAFVPVESNRKPGRT